MMRIINAKVGIKF